MEKEIKRRASGKRDQEEREVIGRTSQVGGSYRKSHKNTAMRGRLGEGGRSMTSKKKSKTGEEKIIHSL